MKQFAKGLINMAQEYKIYFSMKDLMPTNQPQTDDRHKSVEFKLIKTSASYFDLDLPEKYKQVLVSDRHS